MTAETPAVVPAELIAGDTWAFMRAYGDYEAPTWTATIYLEMSGAAFSQAATADGSSHLFTISAATSAGKKAGRYRWWVRVTDGSTSTTVEDGWLDVRPDPASTGTRDHRTWARRTLDAVEATLEGRATSDQLATTIRDRSISRIPLPELMALRDKLRQEVRTEEKGEAAALGRNIKVRFNRG